MLACVAIGRSQALVECWLETSVPLHSGFSTGQLITWQLASVIVNKQVMERGCPRWKPQSFCNLISEVISHHFCHILFTRIGSISPAHNQGEEITQGGGEIPEGRDHLWPS